MVVKSPAHLIGRSHKKQKDFRLTLRTLIKPHNTFAAAMNRGSTETFTTL